MKKLSFFTRLFSKKTTAIPAQKSTIPSKEPIATKQQKTRVDRLAEIYGELMDVDPKELLK
jgi:hypothetical protein